MNKQKTKGRMFEDELKRFLNGPKSVKDLLEHSKRLEEIREL